MKTEKKYTSLLESLSSDQIEALIQEEQLKKAGYKFFFAIDADDLTNYTYPLGLKGDRPEQIKYEYITDEQIALFSLFDKKIFKAFLFSEHREEISQLINLIKSFESEGRRSIDTVKFLLDNLRSVTGKPISEIRREIELVRTNISLILSIAVGLQADGIDKLFQLKKEKKVLFYEDEFIDLLFKDRSLKEREDYEIRPGKITDYIYDTLKDISSNDENDIIGLRKNVSYYRDSIAISKVFSINSFLESKNLNTIVLYISSDFKTQNLFYKKRQNFSDISGNLLEHAVLFNNKAINYHRNTAQIFLRLLCEESTYDEVIENLKTVKKIIDLRELREIAIKTEKQQFFTESREASDFFTQKIEARRKEFADYATMIRIDKFQQLSTSLKTHRDTDNDLMQIPLILEELIKEKNNAQSLENWRNAVDSGLQELSHLNVFRSTFYLYSLAPIDRVIRQQLVSPVIESLKTGEDYIFGEDHHLPMYFLDDDEVIDPKFVKIVAHYKDKSDELKKFVYDFATKLFAVHTNIDEVVLKRCLLLLMLSNSKFFGVRIADYIENFLSDYDFREGRQSANFYYLHIWLMRRNGHYRLAINHSNEALEEFNDDPRFYHSLCLNYYCLFADSKQPETDDLKKSLYNLEKALALYKTRILKGGESKDNQKYIRQNIFALMNTHAYILTIGFQKDRNQFPDECLLNARDILEELKKQDSNYNRKAEFLHTEACLEVQEFYSQKDSKKLEKALITIDSALLQSEIPVKLEELCLAVRNEINNIVL